MINRTEFLRNVPVILISLLVGFMKPTFENNPPKTWSEKDIKPGLFVVREEKDIHNRVKLLTEVYQISVIPSVKASTYVLHSLSNGAMIGLKAVEFRGGDTTDGFSTLPQQGWTIGMSLKILLEKLNKGDFRPATKEEVQVVIEFSNENFKH